MWRNSYFLYKTTFFFNSEMKDLQNIQDMPNCYFNHTNTLTTNTLTFTFTKFKK